MVGTRSGALVAVFLAGCLTHLPPPRDHLQTLVDWADGYDAGAAKARAAGKPLLICAVAGEMNGLC